MSQHLRPHSILLALLVLGCCAVAARAQEDVKGTAKAGPTAAAPKPIKLGEAKQVPATQTVVKPPLTAEEKTLLAIQEDGVKQVVDLTKAMQTMPDGQAKLDLQKKIIQIKQDTWIKMLQARVNFARARGDLKSAQEGEAVIENILHPRAIPTTTVSRLAPEKQ